VVPPAHTQEVLKETRTNRGNTIRFPGENPIRRSLILLEHDIGPLINLGTQHDGRSARTWMKRVLTTFVVVMGGRKRFAREHQNGFYET